MATSSITHNFVISGSKQVEMFANAVEKSYRESLEGSSSPECNINHIRSADDIKDFMAKRGKLNDK